MQKTGAWLLRNALEALGVRHTFGIPGVHTTEIYDELNRSNQIRPMLVTHEAGAAFMADAVSRTSDHIGVLVVVPAAGLTHAMSGVGEAYLDGIPLLVISGGVRTDTDHKYQLHDMDMQALMAPLTKKTYKVTRHDQVMPTIFAAYDCAMTGEPGPVYVEIPVNIQFTKGKVAALPEPLPLERCKKELPLNDIRAAADLLLAARQPGIFLGWGAMKARANAVIIAEKLNAPVATSLQGLAAFPHDHPLHCGMGYGPAAVPAAEAAFAECDVILAVGVRFGEIASASYSLPIPQKIIHIDINPEALGANYRADIAIEADATVALRALAEIVSATAGRADCTGVIKLIAGRKKDYLSEWLAHDSAGKVNPGVFFAGLDKALNNEAIIVSDDGNHTFLTAELMPVRQQRHFISPTDFNCMGYAIPAAIAAKLENRDRQVVAIVGDGAFLMTAMEILTATSDALGVVYFVFSDGELSQIAQAQQAPYGRKVCSILPALHYAPFAQSVGAGYVKITTSYDVETAVVRALDLAAKGQPVIVEVNIDYSKKTRFTKGVLKANLDRFDVMTKMRFIGRALVRRVTG
ncbi:MAG: thiamine pyrophosphate-binding protein [Alphaproteobacteria bacterium]|nr:thiamine pyrophosphate-binding protein [Alphaproteobacteria bacterium]